MRLKSSARSTVLFNLTLLLTYHWELEKLERKTNNVDAKFLALNVSEEAYESNNNSAGTSEVDSKMTPVKAKTLAEDHDPLGSKYEEATQPYEPNIYDDATDELIPNTLPPSATKTSTKYVLSPKKTKKSKMTSPSYPTRQNLPRNQSLHPSPPHLLIASA